MSVSRLQLAPGGPDFSRLALGAWRLADARLEAKEILALAHGAVEAGITTVDHADIYGSYTCEKLFGDALAAEPALRAQLQWVTKCGIKLVSANRPGHRLKQYDTSRAHITASVENSLAQLRIERIDLLLIHRPDPLLDAEEVAQTFVALKQAGKVAHFGVSNFTTSQFELLASRLPFPLVTNQLQFSTLHLDALDNGTLDQCQRLRISPMIWSPLHGGRLLKEESARVLTVREALGTIAKECNATPEQIAIAWILMHPSKPQPVVGTTNLARLRALAESEKIALTREHWFRIWTASVGHEVA
ncbi:MAG TPA: aldo/keto reductase [Verrucomicrobiae bacterium]|jgi:predicted oxidoreductase|nr:aldo/keto reductase [Verrucomicrobiae bacterium]